MTPAVKAPPKAPPKVTSRIETITPEMAVKWLEKNVDNRRLTQATVDGYAADMRDGRWHLTGEPLIFDWNGDLLNGQHRLWACIEANQPFRTMVVRGVDPESRIAVDTAKKRTLGDLFTMRHESSATVLASALNLTYRYERDRLQGSKRNATHEQAVDWLERNPLLRESVKVAYRARKGLPQYTPAAVAAAHYINFRVDAEAAHAFWDRVAAGTNLAEGDPIIALQRWAMLVLGRRDRVLTETQLAVALKTMRHWYEGKPVRQVSFKPSQEEVVEPWDRAKRKVKL